jgi:glycosyltransferase involved in cell wall biosynthesis
VDAAVSVVIPTYNCARYVAEAVESVLAQTFADFETIVVNDGSTDNTEQVLEPYRDRILYVAQPNRGLSAARNAGIRASSGRHIAFLDSDDQWYPSKLARQVEVLSAHPDYAAVHTDSSAIDAAGVLRRRAVNPGRQSKNGMVFDEFFANNTCVALISSVLITRECLDAVGLFDERYYGCQDWDLFLKVSAAYPIWYIAEPLVKYRLTPNSLSRGNIVKDIAHREACLARFIKSHYRLFEGKEDSLRARWAHFYLESAERLFAFRRYETSRRYFREALRRRVSARALLYGAVAALPPPLLLRLAAWKGARRRKPVPPSP